jgi:hypothetical protein
MKKNPLLEVMVSIILDVQKKREQRDIWDNCDWEHIGNFTPSDVGVSGELFISALCNLSLIESDICGKKTKKNKVSGDGTIKKRSCEIKTSRFSSGKNQQFTHDLGLTPWDTDFMIFLDISPSMVFISIFPNFSEAFYRKSASDPSFKCEPVFSTTSFSHQKRKGSFSISLGIRSLERSKFTFKAHKDNMDFHAFKKFVDSIIKS